MGLKKNCLQSSEEKRSYEILPTRVFLEQLDSLTEKSRNILAEKIDILKVNPHRNKRIIGYGLFLFRIRFEDNRKEKRLVYHLDPPYVKILCILDRDKEYSDLKRYLERIRLK